MSIWEEKFRSLFRTHQISLAPTHLIHPPNYLLIFFLRIILYGKHIFFPVNYKDILIPINILYLSKYKRIFTSHDYFMFIHLLYTFCSACKCSEIFLSRQKKSNLNFKTWNAIWDLFTKVIVIKAHENKMK